MNSTYISILYLYTELGVTIKKKKKESVIYSSKNYWPSAMSDEVTDTLFLWET